MSKDKVEAKASGQNELLSAEEMEKVREEIRQEIEDKRRENALADFRKKEKMRLQREEGLVTGIASKDERVDIHLDLAPHSDAIRINGFHYFHGTTHNVPRHVADTLNEIQHRGWKHQNEIDGKSMQDFFGQKRVSEMWDVKKGRNIGSHITASGAVQRLG